MIDAAQTYRQGEKAYLSSIEYAVLTIVVTMALFTTGLSLDRSIWVDEFFTLHTAEVSRTLSAFLQDMMTKSHPLGHYGLVALAYSFGVKNFAALRALNYLGLAIAAHAIYVGVRYKSLTRDQACAVAAVFCSAATFFDYFGELRGYFLSYSFSLALAIVTHTILQFLDSNRSSPLGLRVLWFFQLLILVNIHYFGTLVGGAAALLLMFSMGARNHWRELLSILALSVLAALPAVITLSAQMKWISTTSSLSFPFLDMKQSILILIRASVDAAGNNVPLLASVLITVLWAATDRKWFRVAWPGFRLLLTIAAFFALILMLNTWKPLLVYRYLFASFGFIIVGSVLAGIHDLGPRLTTAAVLLFAMIMQLQAMTSGRAQSTGGGNGGTGWAVSAAAVQAEWRACEGTRIYAALYTDPTREDSDVPSWGTGYRYYATRYGFSYRELGRDQVMEPAVKCPTILWIEHTNVPHSVAELLDGMRVKTSLDPAQAEVHRVGSGVLIKWKQSEAVR